MGTKTAQSAEGTKDVEGIEGRADAVGADGRAEVTATDDSFSDTGKKLHMLALSTCADDMTDNRTMVFCYMTGRRKHR